MTPEAPLTRGADGLFRAPDGEYETIGGLVLAELGHIPQAGESVEQALRTIAARDWPVPPRSFALVCSTGSSNMALASARVWLPVCVSVPVVVRPLSPASPVSAR